MISVRGYAAPRSGAPLQPFSFERRDPGDRDVLIDILYCGVCHSDIHSARGEWGEGVFPLVPGHEIVGRVSRVGSKVKKFKPGDAAGVGCFVDSCRTCGSCKEGLEQYCESGGPVFTYGYPQKDGKPTYGGYSSQIVVDEDYVLKIPSGLALEQAAPLLCAGITTYSPLRHWRVGKGHRVAVLGLGGLGHMAVKLAASLGAEVSVLSTSPSKEAEARRLGAHQFFVTKEGAQPPAPSNHFDFILDMVSAPHDMGRFLAMLRRDGTLILMGAPPEPFKTAAFSLILKRVSLAGSLIGGIRETQEMLDHCGKNNIMADVEVIPMADVNKAYDRVVKGDVRYRFVIDLGTI
jgi:alcohol dehydrogenase (NADP+)